MTEESETFGCRKEKKKDQRHHDTTADDRHYDQSCPGHTYEYAFSSMEESSKKVFLFNM